MTFRAIRGRRVRPWPSISSSFFCCALGVLGCGSTDGASAGTPAAVKPSTPLSGCADVRATAHHADTKVLSTQPSDAPTQCANETGHTTVNTVVVVSDSGALLFAPAEGAQSLRSKDNGGTWELVNTAAGDGPWLHPWMWRDSTTGRVFFNDFPLGRGADGCTETTGAYLWSTDDDGTTYDRVTVGCDSHDWGKIITGPAATETSKAALAKNGYPNMVYYCAEGPTLIVGPDRFCYRSVDGGKTFTRTATNAVDDSRGQTGWPDQGTVGPDGTLFVAHPSPDRGVAVSVSTDEGDSWRDVFIPDTVHTGRFDNLLSVNVTADSQGTIYVTWLEDDDRRPRIAYSKDKGETWSAPLMVGAPDIAIAKYPNISVREPGYVAVAYYASADATGNGSDGYFQSDGRPYDAYLVVTRNLFADEPLFWTARFTEAGSPAIDGMTWPQSEHLGPPAFGPDGSVWAAFVHGDSGLAGRMTPPPAR
jgi:hypothetical protein